MQALGLSTEGVVELTYSLSEHGLMPAAIRSYVAVMSDRVASLNMQQVKRLTNPPFISRYALCDPCLLSTACNFC